MTFPASLPPMTRARLQLPVWVALVGLLAVAPAAAQPRPPRPPREFRIELQKYRLGNGLTVILYPDHHVPSVTVNLLFRVGSKDERAGRSGFAHLFEHLMFMGTRAVPNGEFDRIIETAGGDNDADTNEDRTSYYETGPSNLLGTLLYLEADRLASLDGDTTPAKLDLQREVVLNERRQSYDERPYAQVELTITEHLFPPEHPYHHPVIGTVADLRAASVTDVREFFRAYYVPANAQLVIAGDFDPDEARRLVDRYFGWLPASPEPPHPQVEAPPLARSEEVTLRESVELPQVTVALSSPRAFADGDAECELLAAVLGMGKASRLHRALVQESGGGAVGGGGAARGALRRVAAGAGAGAGRARRGRAAARARRGAAPPGGVAAERAGAAAGARAAPDPRAAPPRARLRHGRRAQPLRAALRRRGGAAAAVAGALRRGARGGSGARGQAVAGGQAAPGRSRAARGGGRDTGEGQQVKPTRALAVLVGVVGLAGCAAGALVAMPREMVLPALPPRVHWRAPVPAVTALPSGMKVALLRDPGRALVHVTAIVKAGSALDGEREGLAAATATMLVEGGAGVRSGPELVEAFEQLGDELEVVADADAVTFHVATRAGRLQRALGLLSDVLMRPRFDQVAWRRERTRRLAEIAAEGDAPDKVADHVFDRVLFGSHPYGHAPLGSARVLPSIEVGDLRAFYAARYGPRTTTLLLVGDVDDAVGQVVAGAFDSWSSGPPSPPAPPPALGPGQATARLVLVDRPGAAQSQVRVGGIGVSRTSPDFPPAMLLDTVLGGSFTSRLMQNLRERHGYTYDARADFVARDAPGALLVKTAVRTDATAAALGEILGELRRLREPMKPDEIAKARAVVEGELIEGFSDGEGASLLLAAALAHGVGGDTWARLPDELAAIDAERLARDAARLIDAERLTVVVVGDRKEIERALATLAGAPPLEVRDASTELTAPPAATTRPPGPPAPPKPPPRK